MHLKRIDELGRVVIPKEIRTILKLKENDILEMVLENDYIKIKKQQKITDKLMIFKEIAELINEILEVDIIITNKEIIVAGCCEDYNKIKNKNISPQLETMIERRENIVESYNKKLTITDDYSIECSYCVNSIIANNSNEGLIIIFSVNKKITLKEQRIVDIANRFIKKYLE